MENRWELTRRELQVIKGLVKGKQYKEIAEELEITLETVRFYIKAIYRKMGVNSRTAAAMKFVQVNGGRSRKG